MNRNTLLVIVRRFFLRQPIVLVFVMRFQLLHGAFLLHIPAQTALSSLYENLPRAARWKRKIRLLKRTERMRAFSLSNKRLTEFAARKPRIN